MTTSRAAAVNVSSVPQRAMTRKVGRSRNRPPAKTAAIMTAPMSTWPDAVPPLRHRSGCQQWHQSQQRDDGQILKQGARRMPSARARWSAGSSPPASGARRRSRRVRARNRSGSRHCDRTPAGRPAPVSAAPVISTWPSPNPNTCFRNTQSRLGWSSRPMMNSRNTTPSSAKLRMFSPLSMRPRPHGPMMMPAAR